MQHSTAVNPRLFPTPDETIAGAGLALREGRTSCVAILEGCLSQIDRWEPRVRAWVALDREGALEQACRRDDELENGKDRGPLHGIPIGIKDIIDVAGLPTACGAKRWADRVAPADADVVKRLRDAGAVVMGKTVTTAYAWIDPPKTRNPWNLDKTPGGSSSGSAAAIACGMCLGAIGTQTGGSIIRPASFCGVSGLKPGWFPVSRSGVAPFAPSLDHVGPIARTVDDLRILFREMRTFPTRKELRGKTAKPLEDAPRLGRLRGFFEHRAHGDVAAAFDDAAQVLAMYGAVFEEASDPVDFELILREHRRIMAAEAAGIHSQWLDEFPDDYPPRIRDLIVEGRSLPAIDYLQAKDRMSLMETALSNELRRLDREFWITAATVSTAPDPSTTGDPAFNAPWSFMRLPAVSFPIGLAADGLPVAIQIIGSIGGEEELLDAAQWCERVIRISRQ